MNNAFVQDEALHLARRLLEDKNLSDKERIQQAYLAVFQRQPTSAEVKRASKFIKAETSLLASAAPEELVERTSTPEPPIRIADISPAPLNLAAPPATPADGPAPTLAPVVPVSVAAPASPPKTAAATAPTNAASAVPTSPPATNTATLAATTEPDPGGNFGGGGGGFRAGGFRGPRTFKGPGSASDIVVGKLAPGIAQPKVFHQALPEKPATPQEGALTLFTQALFGSAEFRYLQ